MKNVVQIDGGIGRAICATGALKGLGKDTVVVTGWLDVFEFSSSIDKQYPLNHVWLYEDVIKGNIFISPEPYHDYKYMNQERHLSQSFNYLLTGEDELVYPELFLSPSEKRWAKDFVSNIKKEMKKEKIFAYQPFGASFDANGVDSTNRSLDWNTARMIAGKVDIGLLNCSKVNLDHPNVWLREFSLRELFAVISECDGILGVDSCVQHIGAAWRKPGVVLLGGTYAANVGWPHYLHVAKTGYPKSYFPNRFSGFKNLNEGAMSFSEEQLSIIIGLINEGCFMGIGTPKESKSFHVKYV